ncbi:MAG: two-component system response regulator [Deltaproteobacteria bacterium CG_4_9_14_3_um_filter_44_9]|nr:MAG: two-component system response regulator [Deltaproteobacteria bacterium CG_4_9_14_3_um_filter_44_9]
MAKKTILVVDDEESHRMMLGAHLKDEGFEMVEASDGQEAVDKVSERFFDLVLMDIRMPNMDGMEALKQIRQINPTIPVLIMTAYGSINSAVQALKSGAEDYLTKPLDMDELIIKVNKVLHYRQLEEENLLNRERLGTRFDFSSIIGNSPKMKELFETLSMVTPTDATVLLLGESGTGKEIVANSIHQNSPRRENPYIKVNCAALPETLLESELFGHEKGAFTGAIYKKRGRFELADGGTIFLDEIGEMSIPTQTKILRVLQEREFEAVGGTRTIQVNVRIITATNKDLEEEVNKRKFREDLYYRLNVVPITVPPLRDRKEDIPILAEYFLCKYNEKNKRSIKGFEPGVIDALIRYTWPGNVRELENIVERTVIMCRGEMISLNDLPSAIGGSKQEEEQSEIIMGHTLRDTEREVIRRTLEKTGGNRTRAATILGITRKTLQNKIKEYRIDI